MVRRISGFASRITEINSEHFYTVARGDTIHKIASELEAMQKTAHVAGPASEEQICHDLREINHFSTGSDHYLDCKYLTPDLYPRHPIFQLQPGQKLDLPDYIDALLAKPEEPTAVGQPSAIDAESPSSSNDVTNEPDVEPTPSILESAIDYCTSLPGEIADIWDKTFTSAEDLYAAPTSNEPMCRQDPEAQSQYPDRYILDEKSDPLHWRNGSVIEYYINPENSSGLSAADVESAVKRTTNLWEKNMGKNVRFEYKGLTTAEPYEADGLNVIKLEKNWAKTVVSVWGSDWTDDDLMTVGVTTVRHIDDEVREFDMALNDHVYDFVTRKTNDSELMEKDLRHVLTHELGHALGLSDTEDNERDVMYFSYHADAPTEPSAEDAGAIGLCYGEPVEEPQNELNS